MRRGFMLLLAAALFTVVSGCANIQDDGTRTRTEGALVGTAGGAAVGAAIGGLLGGGRGALIGAGIGALSGGATGYMVGDHIAKKKAEYASQEEWLDACIDQAKQVNAEAEQYNAKLKTEIAALDQKSAQLAAEYKKKAASKKVLTAEAEKVSAQQKEVTATIKKLEDEVANQKSVARDARQGNDMADADLLDQEIAKMEAHIAELKSYNSKLASISVRMAV